MHRAMSTTLDHLWLSLVLDSRVCWLVTLDVQEYARSAAILCVEQTEQHIIRTCNRETSASIAK
jgi:hypothetical protein